MNTPKGNHWNQIEFSQLVTLKRGQDLTKSDFKHGNIPVAGSNGIIGFHDKANYSGPGVTVGRSGSCGMVQYYENDFWAHNTVLVVDDFKGNHPKFINYYLQFLKLEQFATGASVPTLNRNLFSNLLVNDVSYNEQEQIAFVLSTLQKAIQKQEEIINTTSALKKSLLNKLFTEGTKGEPLKQSEAGMIPQSWGAGLLKDYCEKPTYGYTATSAKAGNAKFLRITDITDLGIDWENVPYCEIDKQRMQNYLLKENDIVFARIGATTGKSYIINNPPANAVYASYLIRVRVKPKHLDPTFLFYFFNSPLYWQQINSNKHNNLKLGVNGSVLQQLVIPKPDPAEQKVIAATFGALDKKINYHFRKKTTYENLFKTLLNELMTGAIRVNEIDFHSKLSSSKTVIA